MALIRDGDFPCQEIPDWLVDGFLERNQTTPQHLAHVDIQYPGIIAQYLGMFVLIDGSHRAKRSRDEGKPYHAHILDLRASQMCRVTGMAKYADGSPPQIIENTSYPEMDESEILQQLRLALHNNQHAKLSVVVSCATEEELEHLRSKFTEEERSRLDLARSDNETPALDL